MRKAHELTGSSKKTVPKRAVFFDSESHVDTLVTPEQIEQAERAQKDKSVSPVEKPHTPYLVCATFYTNRSGKEKQHSQDYYEGEFLEQFWKEVDTFANWREKTYLFAHNAKYDTLVMGAVPHLVALGYECEGFSDSNPFILRMVKKRPTGKIDKRTGKEIIDRKSLLILSSTNYYAQSLAKLGKVFGLPKLDFAHGQPFEFDYAITYCRRDVEILTVAMLAFIKFILEKDLGNFAITVAGQAFNAFRHRFMDETILIHDNPDAVGVERRAYAGGRNECFSMGTVAGRVFGVDVNSMYPSVMWGNQFPVELVTFRGELGLDELADFMGRGYLVCLDAYVDTPYPIFHKKDERLTFPVGQFWTSLSTPEVVEGLERGLIKKVKNVAIYYGAEIFNSYVEFFYNERLKAKAMQDAVHDFLFKMFLNSLYGKFGQRNVSWERIGDAPAEYINVERINFPTYGIQYMIKVFGGGVFRQIDDPEDGEAFNSFCAIASHVTAYARMMLWGYIETAGLDQTHYTDTDSLFTTEQGFQRLKEKGIIHDSDLGKLALEKTGEMILYGCKDYEFFLDAEWIKEGDTGHIVKIKGVTRSSVEIATDEQGRKRFVSTVWGGYSAGLRERKLEGYKNTLMIKTLKREYTKGIVEGDRVRPFTLQEVG